MKKTITLFKTMLLAFILLVGSGNVWGQSYLGLDGGFEGTATIDNTAQATAQAGKWTKANSALSIASETSIVRSGSKSLRLTPASNAYRVYSPQVTISASTTKWVIQYYRRSASTTNTTNNGTGNIRGVTETPTSYSYSTVSAANTWEKVTYAPTSTTSATTVVAVIMAKLLGTGGDMCFDDFSVYESTSGVDNTAPGAPTSSSAGVAVNSLNISWSAPVTGVDGGGYLVVRGTVDPTTAPNVNGIYAVGNSIGTGTVVYQGGSTSFTDSGLTSGTNYYYRIYTYDKAYNYSGSATTNGTPIAALIPTIAITETTVSDMTAEVGSTDAETIIVGGFNLTSDVTLTLSGDNAAMFSLDKTSLTPTSGTLTGEVVTITYKPTTAGSHTATLTVGGSGASDVTRTLNGTATNVTLAVPVATAATDVTSSGFTANWEAVAGATEYDISVYRKVDAGSTEMFKQEFTWIDNGWGGNDDYWYGNIASATAGLAEHLAGWTVTKGFKGDNCIKMGIGDTQGVLQTPALGLNGNATLTFRAGAWDVYGEKTELLLEITGGGTLEKSSVEMALGAFTNYSIKITGGTATTKVTFKGKTASNSRFFLDDVVITQRNLVNTPVAGSPFTVSGTTSKALNGLNPGTDYFYTVKAKKAKVISEASNEISATTLATTLIVSTTENASTLADCASCDLVITPDGHLTVDQDKTFNKVTVNAGGKLTLANGNTLTAPLTIESNSNGTGTYVDKNTGTGLPAITAAVNQYMTYRTWYMGSPVMGAVTPEGGISNIKYYNETTGLWSGVQTTMTAKTGYLLVPSTTTGPSTITFNGTLTNGNQSIALTRSADNKTKPGFNLVGNPYPSYLDWKAVCNYTTDAGVTKPNTAILSTTTMWYRTKESGVYTFYTVNGEGVGTPATASKNIPPMQAFWVRTIAGGGNLALTNDMRLHESVTTNLLKAPAAKSSELQLIRLQVSNGTNTDEAVIYVSENAANNLDIYDSPKMSNENTDIPEIYTTLDNQRIVINAMNSLPIDTEIGLGFVPGDATSFSLKASEISNLPPDLKVILKDNATDTETNLTDGVTVYNFAPATTSGDRFSVIFRSAGSTTAVDENTNNRISVYSIRNSIHVTVNSELNENASVRVFNAVGQQLVNQHLTKRTTTVNGNFNMGVYVVKVSNGTATTATQKIVIK